MSGHSKWSSIKHKKAAADVKKGKIFSKLSRAITVAVKEGGGKVEGNSPLALAVAKAKEYNMPAVNIDKAIKKGTGELSGESYETIVYEGYGPAGVAVMAYAMTDNRNRTAADVRNIFSKHNGNLGTTGCVAWMFDRKGVVSVDKDGSLTEDSILAIVLEAGAEDIVDEGDRFEIISDPADLKSVLEALEAAGIANNSAGISWLAKETVELSKDDAKKVLRFMDALEDHDDIQEVYSNFDILDEIMEELS
ncbi:MAG: YebC/PmpR family DNA-binding transcriptional regulator [Actinomycetota bacterium]|nr:YebC/PmpR family DNA-binding transcriptional regulator [Actinomycetota bacterium]